MHGVILYGPPASGKDTVTAALTQLDSRYRYFPRLKAGNGRTTGYRMTTMTQLVALRDSDELLWENIRYNARYAVDRTYLVRCLTEHIPILHLGQAEAIDSIVHGVPTAGWTIVELWCPWPEAERRIAARRTGDNHARKVAWLSTTRLQTPDLAIDTSKDDPNTAATRIQEAVERVSGPSLRGPSREA